MFKIPKEELIELLKEAHQQGVKLCNCEFDLNDNSEISKEELQKLEQIFESWLNKE